MVSKSATKEEGSSEKAGNKILQLNASGIKNKFKRSLLFQKQQKIKQRMKKDRKSQRKKQAEAMGDEAPPKAVPKTLENTRELDETIVQPDDEEVIADETTDEFADYFKDNRPPKLLITTSTARPSRKMLAFIYDLLKVFPDSHYYKRGTYDIKSICKFGANRDFTNLMVINEDSERMNALTLVHLPEGPTAYFRLSSITPAKSISEHGAPTTHNPELILNNFNTRLGHSVGRMLASLFPQNPEFRGRQAATFHNQRDFLFFRFHRYIFENKKVVRIQELGPRFTLKLRTLQRGIFDKKAGEYEWVYKRTNDTSRRKFYL